MSRQQTISAEVSWRQCYISSTHFKNQDCCYRLSLMQSNNQTKATVLWMQFQAKHTDRSALCLWLNRTLDKLFLISHGQLQAGECSSSREELGDTAGENTNVLRVPDEEDSSIFEHGEELPRVSGIKSMICVLQMYILYLCSHVTCALFVFYGLSSAAWMLDCMYRIYVQYWQNTYKAYGVIILLHSQG